MALYGEKIYGKVLRKKDLEALDIEIKRPAYLRFGMQVQHRRGDTTIELIKVYLYGGPTGLTLIQKDRTIHDNVERAKTGKFFHNHVADSWQMALFESVSARSELDTHYSVLDQEVSRTFARAFYDALRPIVTLQEKGMEDHGIRPLVMGDAYSDTVMASDGIEEATTELPEAREEPFEPEEGGGPIDVI